MENLFPFQINATQPETYTLEMLEGALLTIQVTDFKELTDGWEEFPALLATHNQLGNKDRNFNFFILKINVVFQIFQKG